MSETPEEERPAETTASHPVVPPAEPAPAPAPAAAAAPAQQPVTPVHQRRSFQLIAVGLIGLLLGGFIGLGIGLTAGFAFGGHRGPEMKRHQQYGPGFREPGRKMPRGPFAPPMQRRPNQPVQPVQPGQPTTPPSPQAS